MRANDMIVPDWVKTKKFLVVLSCHNNYLL